MSAFTPKSKQFINALFTLLWTLPVNAKFQSKSRQAMIIVSKKDATSPHEMKIKLDST